MKIYLLEIEWCDDFICDTDVSVYNNIEKAKEEYKKQLEKAKIECDYNTIEESDNCCEMYDEGYFAESHFCIHIAEKEAK